MVPVCELMAEERQDIISTQERVATTVTMSGSAMGPETCTSVERASNVTELNNRPLDLRYTIGTMGNPAAPSSAPPFHNLIDRLQRFVAILSRPRRRWPL